MIAINSICPVCMTKFANALDQLPDDRPATLNLYCPHNKVAVSAAIAPGLVIKDWGLFPAPTEQLATAKVNAARMQQAALERAVTTLAAHSGQQH
ncbi:hypothetical protein [Denitromonas sp.]|uniref:hypothetical protein n=1 Tax=Denitromonas sp. TaxID=2734609 RepID=UPI003A842467